MHAQNLRRADSHSSFPSLAKISRKRDHLKYLDKLIFSGLNYAGHQHAPKMDQSHNSR